jgi:hypothetical protein
MAEPALPLQVVAGVPFPGGDLQSAGVVWLKAFADS